MKFTFLLLGLVLFILPCTAQDAGNVDSQPIFRGGGIETFNDWVFKMMFFTPDEPVDLGEEGVVSVRFTVDKKGQVKDLSLVSAYDQKLANRLISTIKKAPRWTPGTKNGEPVDTEMTADIELMYDLISFSYRPDPMPNPDSLKSLEKDPDSRKPYFKVQNDENEFRSWVGAKMLNKNGGTGAGIFGLVELGFIVNKGGYVEDVHILKSSTPRASRIAMRVLYDCPKWCQAGFHNGEYVIVKYSVPIVIKAV